MYAAFEGLLLGGISAMFEARYPGIVINAVALTFGTLAALLAAYSTRASSAPARTSSSASSPPPAASRCSTWSRWCWASSASRVPYIHDSGPIGIVFSVFVVVIAALNLVLDFDFIERGAEAGAPKYMEWVRRLRAARHAGLAVPRDPPPARQAAGRGRDRR